MLTAEKRPFRAYSGGGKYIFASYSHADSRAVYETLGVLFCKGYNIWYDQGIPNNSVLDSRIAAAIRGCDTFILFLSPNSAASGYVTGKELPLAKKKRKNIIFVRLHDRDETDYSALIGGEVMVDMAELASMLPQNCRECEHREPAPIETDLSAGLEFCDEGLYGIEYYIAHGTAVITSYNNLGAVNDDKYDIDELKMPDTLAGCPVKCVEGFDYYESMRETERLVFADTVEELGEGAFRECWLQDVVLPTMIKEIPDFCFEESWLDHVVLPYGLVRIGESAFASCERLEEDVYIPETVVSIGDGAFYDCTELAGIIIPPQTVHIGKEAFDENTTIFCVEGSAAQRYAEENGLEYNLVETEEMERYQAKMRQERADALTRIEQKAGDAAESSHAGAGTDGLAYVIVTDKDAERADLILSNMRVDGIEYAVADSLNKLPAGYAAAVLILSRNTADIDFGTAATDARIFPIMLDKGAALPQTHSGRFVLHADDRTPDELYAELRGHLESCGCKAKNMRSSQTSIDFVYYFYEDNGIELHKYQGNDEIVRMPDALLGRPVLMIEDCFVDNTRVREVEVGCHVRIIEAWTFKGCPSLERIIMPESVTEIDGHAILECPKAVIYASHGSYAYEFAKKRGLRVKRLRGRRKRKNQ